MDTEKIIKRIQRVSLSCDLKTDEGIRHFHNGHEYVEIGGIKWATMNIGAKSITDYGLYFQWGDVQGYTAKQVGYSVEGKKAFKWADYKYCIRTNLPWATDMTKYNNIDGKKVLDLEDDAVRYHWGGSWRMPTNEEIQALGNSVNKEWITNYNGSGVSGFLCTDKNDSSKALFFPSAGYAANGVVDNVGFHGCFWSSSLYTLTVLCGRSLCFYYSRHCSVITSNRFYGFSVRGVVD